MSLQSKTNEEKYKTLAFYIWYWIRSDMREREREKTNFVFSVLSKVIEW